MPQTLPTVFLSSTAEDLRDFRDAVHARLVAGGKFRCIRQEDFTGLQAETVKFCSEQAAGADLFVRLIGMRRGWEPDGDVTQRSITEIEYDCAKQDNCFIYVTAENFQMAANLRESDAKYQRQLAFRQRVKSRIVSKDGFSSPDKLAQIVVEHLLVHINDAPIRSDHEALSNTIVAKLMTALDTRGETQRAAAGGIERQTIISLAKRLKPSDTLDFDRAIAELENAVSIALDVVARGRRGGNDDQFVNDVLAEVAKHTKAAQFDRAVAEIDAGLKEIDAREAEQRESMRRARITLLEAGLEQDILRRDAVAAAKWVQRIVGLEHADDVDARFEALRARQIEFYERGRDKGINVDLEIAIDVARLSLGIATAADARGAAGNDLGTALATLGERESDPSRLEQAVAAYRSALLERTRERVPLQWATTQNNLGNALWRLGERASDPSRLEQAVEAYRAALLEYTRERVPLDWAMTQNNLGNALRALGERESDPSRLEQAVEAYRAALLERTRERVPLAWAMTQNNLGTALQTLGERASGIERLEQAVEAYRSALLERTRERVPLDWAQTQNNLGTALQTLGERERDPERLEQAVEAFRASLDVFEEAKASYYIEVARDNLARAEALLAERRKGQ